MRIYKQSVGIGVPSESFYLISAGGVTYSIEETRFHSNGNGNSTMERYNIPDLGYEDQNKEINYQIQDHLGNLRLSYTVLHCPSCSEQNCASVDVQYQINYIAEYLAYGGLLREFVRNGRAGEKFLSTGHERDKQTSWDYRQARYYDADLGRFLAVDPLGVFRIWLSPYNYCQNNPIKRVDLTGALDWEPDGKGRLRAQAGDNEETLAQHLNIHEGQARRIFHDLKNWDGGTNLNGIKDVEGHILTIGVNLLHLSPTPTLRESYFYTNTQEDYNWGRAGNALLFAGITLYSCEKLIHNNDFWVDANGNIKHVTILDKGSDGKYINRGVQGLRNGRDAAARVSGRYAYAGKIVGGLGMGVTVVQFATGQISSFEATVDLVMGGIGFTPWGAPISLAYFAGKFVYEYTTGDSLFIKPNSE